MEEQALSFGGITIGLVGGLAIFLYGMEHLTDALKIVAGARMRNLLARLTTNRFKGVLAGTIVTAAIQSSSVTTVLLVGFVSAGLMSLQQSIGVIMGASIGTTITAQIIAFKITELSLLMIGAGFFTELVAKQRKLKLYGVVLMGLGLLFFGMELMSQATEPLRTFEPFLRSMRSLDNVLVGALIGAAFTAIVQSSSATTGIVILFAAEGLLTLEAGIAVVLGANIGTCVTALLAAIGKPQEARQVAFVHVIVNVLGVLLWLGFVPQFAELVLRVTATADPARQIANAHTLFNLVNLVLFIWLIGPLARLVVYLTPLRPEPVSAAPEAMYLDKFYLDQPAIALDRVQMELVRLGTMVLDVARDALPIASHGTPVEVESLHGRDDALDALHGQIITYLGKLSQKDLVEPQPARLHGYIAAANAMESVGDVIETGYVYDARQRLDKGLRVSPATLQHLKGLHDFALTTGARALQSFKDNDAQAAREVEASKAAFNALAEKARSHLARRLIAEEPARLDTYRLETDLIENLKRIHTLFRRLAKTVAE